MGNIFHCCRIVSGYFSCRDALTHNEPERSALLSSDDSDCDPANLSDNFEEDLSTVSTGVTNLTLEPENFLFPDIILSSSLGGDVTLVEPMVCLLVSEEGEAARLDEGSGRSRVFSEVETQTEVETWISSQAQTQTEMLDSRAEDPRRRGAEAPGGEADAATWSEDVNRINKESNDGQTEVHSNGEEQHILPSRHEGRGDESQHSSAMQGEHAKNLDHFTCVDETEQKRNTGTKPQAEQDVGQTFSLWINFKQHQENLQLLANEEMPHRLTEEEEEEMVQSLANVPAQADGTDCVKGEVFVFAATFYVPTLINNT